MNFITRWLRTQKALTTILNNQQYIKHELDKLKQAVAWMNDWFAECKGCKKIYFKHLINESNEGLCWYCVRSCEKTDIANIVMENLQHQIEIREALMKEYKPIDKQKEEKPSGD